jgi:histidine triad (HIT) family protein
MAECVFCEIVAGTVPAHVVLDDGEILAFLDKRPLFKGHTLVVPRAHLSVLADLPAATLTALFLQVRRLTVAVTTALGAQGSLVIENNVVSQSVPHVHVHVVPRDKGDGFRGFFWPRHPYADEAEAADYATRLRAALSDVP